jgi:hypothetical protein
MVFPSFRNDLAPNRIFFVPFGAKRAHFEGFYHGNTSTLRLNVEGKICSDIKYSNFSSITRLNFVE